MRLKSFTLNLLMGAACLILAGCGGGDDSGGVDSGGGDGGEASAPEEPGGGGDGESTFTPDEPADDGDSELTSTPDDPPDDDSTSSGYPVMDAAAAESYAGGAEFRRIEPDSAAEAAVMQLLGHQPACGGGSEPGCVSAVPYELQNIHHAHTATLDDGSNVRGKGVLIAVLDDGFRTTHQELAGKNIQSYLGSTSSLAVADHGTAVASIAAGKADGVGMMGVAPDADLHLTSWGNVAGNNLLSHLTAATDDAGTKDAAVQNNSWGWDPSTAVGAKLESPAGEERANFESSGATSYAEYLAGGDPNFAAEWQGLFDAYDSFQSSGVIVFANSNDETLGDATAWAALPLFVPELSEAWITVSNALFTLNESDGSIRSADLLSAPCGSAAQFCLTSDGTTYIPSATSDASYAVDTGTSFAAPQVSGQIALLAQAFPNLAPAEWTVRLLATTRQDWDGFQNSIAGQQTFASGVTRSYSDLYGHGVADMKAALSPVGGLSIASGENVFTAERTSLDEGITTSGPVVGNSVAKAIAGHRIMVVDALGTDFYVRGSALNGKGGSPAPGARQMARNVDQIAAKFAFAETEGSAAIGLHDAAVPKLFFSQTLANLEGDTAFSQLLPLAGGGYLQFAGHMQETTSGSNTAFSISRLTTRSGFSTELSFSFGQNTDSFFGNGDVRGPFMAAENTSNLATGLSVSKTLTRSWSVGAYMELGSSFVDDNPSTLVDYGSFAYASGGLTARRREVLTDRDMLDFYAGVRPAAIAGKAEVSLPVGREADGTINYEDLSVDLAKSDLPLRLGLVYQNRTKQDVDLLFGFNTDFLAGSDAEPVYSVSLGLKKEF